MLCTQVPYWIHGATQFFWCFKTPANSCPILYHPELENHVCYKRVRGGWPKHCSLYTTAVGFFLHTLCSFSCHFSKHIWVKTKYFILEQVTFAQGECQGRCKMLASQPTLPKHTSHSLAGTWGLWGCWRVCWNDPPNSTIRPTWFWESSNYGA